MTHEGRGLPPLVHAHGFSARKRPILRRFLYGRRVRFVRESGGVPPGGTLLLWGSSPPPHGLGKDVRIVRVEDGFLRSVGLGADLVRPLSLVMDDLGIYYDATRPSALERILQTAPFSPALLERAARMRGRIVESGLTKYNVGGERWTRPAGRGRVILVPGQVETDASVRFGAPGIGTNIGLLRAVRVANPEAYVVYKPHPDVMAGVRGVGLGERDAPRMCDEVVGGVPMGRLLQEVDEAHVLTSLTGFEALLRRRRVVCYGQPFYAGWGLTTDIIPPARRTRRLTLDGLVAGTLILYPEYSSRATGMPCEPEQVLDELLEWRASLGPGFPLGQRAMRWMVNLATGRR